MTRSGGHPIEDFEPVSLQLAGWGHRQRAQLAYDLREEERQRRGAATPGDTDANDTNRDKPGA
ncbi:hypothetical protein Q5424_01195 [Conexibacter sp. JD483]|uniref:hypothetical protein n=1 Tax=unclassified Conexibacter TaxID=2627773 RepID=UPI00271F6119|nr:MULTISPECIES: hypothetical protein [unclassified Conexibacter]MDO8185844.1 hypothetical protein [Conexibacter sp. CPCC 205706]MDO8198588.1 hypothetical protein [Conexibacter sp. CPCC 205762]MDR9367674.1 hypothetical protein [Conexibacter sp. JD483]